MWQSLARSPLLSVVAVLILVRTPIVAQAQDTTPPQCVSARGTFELNKLVVTFSEPMDSGTTQDSSNYAVVGFNVLTAVLGPTGTEVTLTLDPPLTADTDYSVNVQRVQDMVGLPSLPCTLPFRTFVLSCGFALQELYLDIQGDLLSDLAGNLKFPDAPDHRDYITLLEGPLDAFDNYGTRLSGWIIPPVSGNYNFYMSSDDQGAFYLSTDASPANTVLICSEPDWNPPRDWLGTTRRNAAAPENRSTTLFPGGIPLTAGQMHYFEVLAKESGGTDSVGVAWQLPGAPMPQNGSAPISGIYLAALADSEGASLTITQQPADQLVLLNPGGPDDPATFSVAANFSPAPLSIQWERNNGAGYFPVPGANSTSFSFVPTPADNGAAFRARLAVPGFPGQPDCTLTSEVATLTAVQPNTPPSFTCGPDIEGSENSGPVTVPNWATDIRVHSIAGSFSFASDFNSLPPGTRLLDPNGAGTKPDPRIEDGILKLTDANDPAGFGGWAIGPFPELTFQAFQASWMSLVGDGSNGGADGYSLNVGNDLADSFLGEEGTGTGLSVTIDTWDNGGGEVGIEIKWLGNLVAFAAIPKDDDGNGNFLRKAQFVPASLDLSASGIATFTYDGNTISAQLPSYAGLVANQINFGARVGGANDNHWMDDVNVMGFEVDDFSAETGQTVQFIVSNDNPGLFAVQPALSSAGTLTYTTAPGACGTANLTVVAMDNGGTAFGGDDTSDECSFTIVVQCCPVADPFSVFVNEGGSANFQLPASDEEDDPLAYTITQAPAHGTVSLNTQTGAATYSPAAGYCGPDGFKFRVFDGQCQSAEATVDVTICCGSSPPATTTVSVTPAALWPANHKLVEVTATVTSEGGCGPATCTLVSVTSNEPENGTGDGDTSGDIEIIDDTHFRLRAERAAKGDGRIYTITYRCTDSAGNSTTSSAHVRVSHNIVSPASGAAFKINSPVGFAGTFWDLPGSTHKATWTFDGLAAPGAVSEPTAAKNGTVTGTYAFTVPGVYKVGFQLTDASGVTSLVNTAGDLEAIVVVFDPNGGYALGGGYIDSPAGAFRSEPHLTGKLSFGFSSKYFKRATNPKGETQVQFKLGNLDYNALNFEYLAISGAKAQFRGFGKLNGASGYNFIMTVVDGQLSGGGGVDKFRIKIWNKATGVVVYDTQPGASDAADPTTPVATGSTIVIKDN